MLTNTTQIRQGASQACRRGLRKQFAGTAAMALCLAATGGAAHAEAPAAGTIIGNQAIATFSDGFETRSVTSNLVQTEINKIYAVDIEADQTKVAAVDGLITFPHTVTNLGNVSDSFALTLDETLPSSEFDNILIYADADFDGVPDSNTPIMATPSLAPGEQFGIVIEADLAPGVLNNASPDFVVTATSTVDATATAANTDTITVTNTNPVLDLLKSVTFAPSGDVDGSGTFTPGDILTFRLTYSNSQPNTSATAFIVDDLNLPNSPLGASADLTYIGDPEWSDGGTLDDASDEFAQNINGIGGAFPGVDGSADAVNGSGERVDIYYDSSTNEVQIGVDINSQSGTREGWVEFDVEIGALATGTPVNIATIDGQESNEVPIPIPNSASVAVVLNDSGSDDPTVAGVSTNDLADDAPWVPAAPSSGTDDGASGNDIILESTPVAEGAVVPFEVVLTNHSDFGEIFNMSVDNVAGPIGGVNPFPAGTTFSFYTAGGAPLLDADSDGILDILVAANTAVVVQVRADLPAASAGMDYNAVVTATSSSNPVDPNGTNSTVISLAEVVAASVDLENQSAGNVNALVTNPSADALDLAHGPNFNNSGEPWTVNGDDDVTNAVGIAPGETTTFELVVENNALASDSFNLSYVAGAGFDGTVVFRAGASEPAGALVTNTGLIAGEGFTIVTAYVTVADGHAAGDFDLTFTATSATNGSVTDSKLDAVRVAEIADLEIVPDREGDLAAGGVLTLSHTLTNLGNVTVTEGAISFTGFPTLDGTLYLDDGDGVFELDQNEDTPITNISTVPAGLAPGESVIIWDRVQASASAVAGLSESADITVSTSLNGGTLTDPNADNNEVTDTVTIISGDLEVLKRQRIDTDCDLSTTEGGLFTTLQLPADPGECIVYEITATNTGTADALTTQIIDSTPAFTTYVNPTAVATTDDGTLSPPTATVTSPAGGATGDVISDHGTLIPGAEANLTFMVQIDN